MIKLLLIIFCYLIGSMPFGYIVAKLVKKIDIRDYGSGNIGATNAFRVLGPWFASLVLIGDLLKGFLAIVLFYQFNIDSLFVIILGGLAVIGGHDWSVFLKFKGGKGIATTYGVFLALNPKIALLSVLIWLIVIALTKYASLASILSLSVLVVLMVWFKQPQEYIIFSVIILALGLYRHRGNIVRLKEGKEKKFLDRDLLKKNK
ncbi:MAG: glycerol-3-phosphate 1-O-acyltransferase PlsY [Candidatus Caldatribacteriota bacterium]|nr:glycerol-3-phosphate 1-O-acyltransferase PlsY [Candidatus Caldatribacteriota bacterium]